MATDKTDTAPQEQAKPARKEAFAALVQIQHDGEVFQAGEEVLLAEKEAAPLLAVGAVQPLRLHRPHVAK
jgi:hypothetical protein